MPDIKIIDNQGNKIERSDPQTPNIQHQSAPDQILKTAVEQVMDLDTKKASKYRDAVDILTKYAKMMTTERSPEQIKWVVRNLEMKLGSPPLSEARVAYVARFAYMRMEKAKIEKELSNFEPDLAGGTEE